MARMSEQVRAALEKARPKVGDLSVVLFLLDDNGDPVPGAYAVLRGKDKKEEFKKDFARAAHKICLNAVTKGAVSDLDECKLCYTMGKLKVALEHAGDAL